VKKVIFDVFLRSITTKTTPIISQTLGGEFVG